MALNFDHQQDRVTTQSGNFTINTNGSIRIPVGNTAQRPSTAATGQIRFNSQLNRFEGYNGTLWKNIGGVVDADQDTFIEVDNPLDDDSIRFYTAGTERITIDATGKLTVEGEAEIKGNLSLGGNITIGNANTDLINVNAQFKNSLIPFDDNSYDFGTSAKKWKNIFLSGTFDNSTNTGSLILPQGTDAQRPNPAQTGMLRFSTTSNKAEIYDGTTWVEVGAGGGASETFRNIAVSGQSTVVADSGADTLTLVAGTGISITTDATTDEITIATTGGGGGSAQNLFDKIAVSGQNNIVADNTSDTLTFIAGSGMSITTNSTNDSVTFTSTGSYSDSDVDAHLNQSTAQTGEVLSWNGSDYDWISNAGYSDADVDTHLNLSTANTGQALIYNGVDYSWGTVGGAITIQDEGTSLTTAATTINFVGAGVTASGTGSTKTITITGGGGGGGTGDAITDADADTHIKVEATTDEDKIRFTTAGTERARIDSNGDFIIGDPNGTTFYKLPTTRGTTGQVPVLDANGNATFQTIASGSGTAFYQNTAPTVGVNAGDLWFDTGTTAELYVYTGGEWVSVVSGADTGFIPVNFTGDGTTQAFNANVGNGTVSMVFLNGVLMQNTNDYTETGGIVTFVGTPQNGDAIDIIVTGEIVAITLPQLGLTNHTLITIDGSGNLQATSLQGNNLTDNRVLIAGNSGLIEDDANLTFDGTDFKIATTGAVQIPSGTTAQRPTPATGMLRFNSQTSSAEIYDGASWGSLGGATSQDQDGDTRIEFETSLGNDNDALDFYTAGTQRMQINSLGNFSFGAGLTKFTIDYTSGATQINGANVHSGNSGVSAGSYGSGILIPVVTVDAEGHVTSVSTVTPTFSPTPDSINDTHIDFGTGANQVNTDDLPEGSTNLYYTQSRFDTAFTAKSTSDLSEGTNLYFTNARAQAVSINEVVEDTTPQLGGNLDVMTHQIVSSSGRDIEIIPDGNGNVGIGQTNPSEKLHVDGAIRINGVSTLETAATTLATTTQSAIDTFALTKYRSCKYVIQATDTVSNEYQITEALLIHDGSTAYVSVYGIVMTGSAELFSLDADTNSGNARLLATGASTNSTQYKVIRQSMLV